MLKVVLYIKNKALLYGIFGLYLIGGLVIGEFHPFSMYPMYNNLPNWSYVFYFADEHNKLIHAEQLGTNGGALGHLFSNTAYYHKIPYGNGVESKDQLHFIGQKMMTQVLGKCRTISEVKKLKLIRVYYCLKQGKIEKHINCIYEKSME